MQFLEFHSLLTGSLTGELPTLTLFAMERDKQKVIGVSELKAKCTGIVQKVQRTGTRYVVTVRGEPAVEIRPLPVDVPRIGRLGTLAGTARITGDIVSSEGDEFDYDADVQGLLS